MSPFPPDREVDPEEFFDDFVIIEPPLDRNSCVDGKDGKPLEVIHNNGSELSSTSESAMLLTDATEDASVLQQAKRDAADCDFAPLDAPLEEEKYEVAEVKRSESMLSEEEWKELRAKARKAGIAFAGGSLVAVGVVLAPLPTPAGEALIVGGVGVLATEFPAAQRVIDGAKEKAAQFIDSLPDEDDDKEKDGGEEGKKTENSTEKASAKGEECKGMEIKARTREDDIIDAHYQAMKDAASGVKDAASSVKKKAIKLSKSVRPHLEPDAEMPSMNIDMDEAGKKMKHSFRNMQNKMGEMSQSFRWREKVEQIGQLVGKDSVKSMPIPPRF